MNDFLKLIPSKPNSYVLRQSTCAEVTNVIKGMSKEGGLYDKKRTILIITAPSVSPIISQLFSRCIDADIFPKNLKIAKVTSVAKKGAKSDISNYRPISVLNNITKIFEGPMYKRIQKFLK